MKSPRNYFDVAGFIKLFIYKAQAVCCSSLGISIASRISRLVRWFFLIFWTQRSTTVYRRIYTAGKIGPDRRQKIGPEWPHHFCKETVSFSRGQRRLYPQKTWLSGPFFWRVRTNLVFCIDRIHQTVSLEKALILCRLRINMLQHEKAPADVFCVGHSSGSMNRLSVQHGHRKCSLDRPTVIFVLKVWRSI